MKIEIPRYGNYDEGETIDCGKGYTAVVKIEPDEFCGEPWKECDGHGPVSDWEHRDKRPGELILNEDHGSKRFYDFAEAVKLARRNGWNTKPYYDSNIETAGERAHRAAMADYENLRAWCNDEWRYIYVLATMYRHDEEIACDILGGVESFGDYWQEIARDMVANAIDSDIKDRKLAAVNKSKETRERNFWACRDVATK